MRLICRHKSLDLTVPRIMGIVNITPDSFSDGGKLVSAHAAIDYAHRLIEAGADMIDVGGESTRTGAAPVSEEDEIARVVPVIAGLQGTSCIISVDTRNPRVMHEAIVAGADMVNDVQALGAPGALQVVAKSGVAVCLMHMRGSPESMQQQLEYGDVVTEVRDFLQQRQAVAVGAGVRPDSILLDPGIGFGKSLANNLLLIKHLALLGQLGAPLLVGLSRKSMLGQLTGRAVTEREAAGISANLYAYQCGARVLRVHDVAACRDALTVWQALEGC
jgi:dihydropteroate synthase